MILSRCYYKSSLQHNFYQKSCENGRHIILFFNFSAGPWIGRNTPDINNSKRFLRGGSLGEAFEVEEDAFQEHHHEHYHNFADLTSSRYVQADWGYSYYLGIDNADVEYSTHGAIHGRIVAADQISDARIATETRPKNIKVVYVMKCWHIGLE